MRIAFDAKRFYHNRTGLGNYCRTLVNGLQALNPSLQCLLYDAKSFQRTFTLGRQARKDGAWLYHGLSNELPFDILRSGVPSVVTIHDVCWRTFPSMYHWIDRHLYDLKYGWAARHADRVLAISESTKHDVMRHFCVPEDRIRVVYQPVGEIYYTPISRDEAWQRIHDANLQFSILPGGKLSLETPTFPSEYMLYVGSVNSRKNLLGVVQAMALLPASCRLPLVVVGNGREYKKLIIQEIERTGLGGLVHWVSCSDDRLLQAIYTAAHIFVFPSFYEGFGLPVVEAQLCGLPVVTSNVSSLPEAGGPHALQVSPADIEEMAHAIERALCDTALREQMNKLGRQYAFDHFSPQPLFQQVLNVYKELC